MAGDFTILMHTVLEFRPWLGGSWAEVQYTLPPPGHGDALVRWSAGGDAAAATDAVVAAGATDALEPPPPPTPKLATSSGRGGFETAGTDRGPGSDISISHGLVAGAAVTPGMTSPGRPLQR